jgi:hypothetical protein
VGVTASIVAIAKTGLNVVIKLVILAETTRFTALHLPDGGGESNFTDPPFNGDLLIITAIIYLSSSTNFSGVAVIYKEGDCKVLKD